MSEMTDQLTIPEEATPKPARPPKHAPLELSHHSGGRGFVAVFLAAFALGWLLLLAINVLGNSTNLFPSPRHPAQSERAWKTRRIDALTRAGTPPEVVVLGSSRVMQIRPSYVSALAGGARVFNYGVSAANPVDWTAQVGYLLHSSAKPKTIILGVDEFCFGSMTSHWQLQSFGHAGLIRRLPWPEVVPMTGEVLSNVAPDNTWRSFRAAFKHEADNPTMFVSKSEYVLPDGYMIYRSVEEAREKGSFDTLAEVRKSAKTFANKVADQPDEGMALTPRRTQLFERVLDECRSNGVEVKVMLLPLHPEYARIVMGARGGRLGRIWDDVAAYLAKTCPEHGATFRDFRDPKSFGADPNGFWDGQHMTSENDRRMLNVLYGLKPEQLATPFPTDLEIINAVKQPEPPTKKRRR